MLLEHATVNVLIIYTVLTVSGIRYESKEYSQTVQSMIRLHQTDIGYIRSRSVLFVIPGHFKTFTAVIQL